MPRHPSVPANQTGWVKLGVVGTDTALIAIVAPEVAGILGDEWGSRYLDEDGEPLPPADGPAPEHELVEFEEFPIGDDDDHAVLFTTHADGGYLVEGRFGDVMDNGRAELLEVRIRLWYCECTCHDDADEPPECQGTCHDADPA